MPPALQLTIHPPTHPLIHAGAGYLPAELQEISASAAALTDDHKGSEARLSHLFGIVTDLYIDKFKFRGKDATRRVPALMDVLNSYSLAALRDFFAESW